MAKNTNIETKLSIKGTHRKSITRLSKESGRSEKQILDVLIGLGLRQYRKRKTNKGRKADVFLLIASLIGITAGVIYVLLTR